MKKLLSTLLLVVFCGTFAFGDASLRLDTAGAFAGVPAKSSSAKAKDSVALSRRPKPPAKPRRRPEPRRRKSDDSDKVLALIVGMVIGGIISSGSSAQ